MLECLEKIEENLYRCKLYGFIIRSSTDYIRCGMCKKDKEDGPSLIQMATNFTKAVIDQAKGGFKYVNKDEFKRRINICMEDKCGFYYPKQVRCLHQECGCFLKIKCWWDTQKCPIGLW